MPKQQDIRTLVDQFVSDISARVHQQALDTVRAALGGGAAPARRGPGRPRGSGKRGPGRPRKAGRRGPGRPRKLGRRSQGDVAAVGEKVLAYVRANPGQRLEEIGRGLRTDTAGLKRPIQRLVADGKLRTEGQKRGTKYFAGGRGRGKKKAGRRAGRRGKARTRRAPVRAKRAAKRKLSPEQRAALLERLAKARAARKAKG
jgi:hypothetical protein